MVDDKVSGELDFRLNFATYLSKVIAVVVGLGVLTVSRYAFIFFSAAMLPTIVAVFIDRNQHKCISATICSFNLIGALPYLVRLWESPAINNTAKMIIADIDTWLVIYGAAFVGQLLYLSLPLMVIRFYDAKAHVKATKLLKIHDKLCQEWGIPLENNDTSNTN